MKDIKTNTLGNGLLAVQEAYIPTGTSTKRHIAERVSSFDEGVGYERNDK